MLIVCTSVYNHSCKLQVTKTDDEVSLVGVIYSLSDNGAPIARWRFRPKGEPGGWKNFGILYIQWYTDVYTPGSYEITKEST